MNDLEKSRILITGGAGFVGSALAARLLDEGAARITITDNLVRGSMDNIKKILLSGRVGFVKGDIRDTSLLDDLLREADYCFHMAALRITHCAEEPREAFDVMFGGTFNVAEACARHGLKKVVFASSASIYGMADTFPTGERHHPYNNLTLYGAAKTAGEQLFRSFYHMYGLRYAAMRYFNIYGPGMDRHGKYTEVLIKWHESIKRGDRPLIYGDGSQTMDLVFIDDVVTANILALKTDIDGEVFNVGSGSEKSLSEICLSLLEAMGSGLKPEYVSLPEGRSRVEVTRRLADTAKAGRILGFEAKTTLKEGLARLIAWL